MTEFNKRLVQASRQKIEKTFDSTLLMGNFRNSYEDVFVDRYQNFRSNTFFIVWVVSISFILYGIFFPKIPHHPSPTTPASVAMVDTYDYSTSLIKEAIREGFSEELAIGARLFPEDTNQMKDLDYTLTYIGDETLTKVWLWDYAGVDGDVVLVKVNGVEFARHTLTHDPISFEIPLDEVETLVEVVGITDGGGGITYAIYFDFDGASYFNRVQKGSNNHYTFIRE
ncbi:hypothetical protein [Entomospira culicis]|uniref:Uncharacterized protein n=1 Tax=Entomospira culicis TaxID=2719989 RepID=A0A968KUC6_9SPIO|nr:hypothetical protein [Entomospira culicis]NIZ19210.1 hypothetical protein [Entomospira culicis]NIZ69424.1 hypothetical protein [Entomospira culicis]WDI36540.1 hypothetical protein PVA46_04250 [Entomospira culicis]WDI38166.1 hypothetical protein PVA47_04250 [Entomospira culicis]